MREGIWPYFVAGIGLFGILLSSKNILSKIPVLNLVPVPVILLPSIGLVAIAIIIMLSQGKGGKGEKSIKEVPVYHKDKIVAYRRHY